MNHTAIDPAKAIRIHKIEQEHGEMRDLLSTLYDYMLDRQDIGGCDEAGMPLPNEEMSLAGDIDSLLRRVSK